MNIKDMTTAVTNVLEAGLVPMIIGSPGIGKSDIIRTIADQYKLKVIDIRLAQADPTDLNNNQACA